MSTAKGMEIQFTIAFFIQNVVNTTTLFSLMVNFLVKYILPILIYCLATKHKIWVNLLSNEILETSLSIKICKLRKICYWKQYENRANICIYANNAELPARKLPHALETLAYRIFWRSVYERNLFVYITPQKKLTEYAQ